MQKGDLVAHKENGIVGTIIKEYKPTGAERQIMIKTLDERQYHAPMEEWVKLRIGISDTETIKKMLMREIKCTSKYLNPYGEYVVKFAKNHGISIREALDEPMVKARYNYFNMTGR